MSLRSARERFIQTVAYEVIGLCLAVPAYLFFYGGGASDGFFLIAAISVAVMLWSPFHNTAFDWLELRLAGRLASDRPQHLRLVHALSHEATAMMLTVPILIIFGGHGFLDAVVVDFVLTAAYAAYAYFFHLIYDRLRPVRQGLPSVTSFNPQ